MLGWVSRNQKGKTALRSSKEEQKNDKMGTISNRNIDY